MDEYLSTYSIHALFKSVFYWAIDTGKEDADVSQDVEQPKGKNLPLIANKNLVLEKDDRTKVSIFFYLQSLMKEEQVKYAFDKLVGDISNFDALTKERLIKSIDDLLDNNRAKELQNLLSKKEWLFDTICQYKGFDEAQIKEFFLNRSYPERMMYFWYIKENVWATHVNLKKLENWWQDMNALPYLAESSRAWAKWLYVSERMIASIRDVDSNLTEEAFFAQYEEELKAMPAYPYDETDYIKRMAEKQSEIFCFFFRKRWDVKRLMDALGQNNVFLYEKDGYYASWPRALITDDVLKKRHWYGSEINGLKECYQTAEELVYIYMNTNMRFIYNLKQFLNHLKNGKEDVASEAEKIESLFADYPIRARLVRNYPNVRARGKLQLIFYTVYTGCNNEKALTKVNYVTSKNMLLEADEKWCEANNEDIWSWPEPPVDCICNVGYSVGKNNAAYPAVKNIVVEEELKRTINKAEELQKFIDWLQAVKEDGIVYDPHYFAGKNSEDYREYRKSFDKEFVDELLEEEVLEELPQEITEQEEMEEVFSDEKDATERGETTGAKFEYGRLCAFAPSKVTKKIGEEISEETIIDTKTGVAVAKLIVEVFLSLKASPEKVRRFLITLNMGSIDAVNEFKYNHKGRNNGGILNNKYQLTYSQELKNIAEHNLKIFCKEEALPVDLIADIYMNTYLKQYVSIVDFFSIIRYSKGQLDYHKFIASEYRNEDNNRYRFCVKNLGERNFELFPGYEDASRKSEITWLGNLPAKYKLDDKNVGKGVISGIDFKHKIVYLDWIRPANDKKENKNWDSIYLKFVDLKKAATIERINELVDTIKKKTGEYKKFDYFYGTRLVIVSQVMLECFTRYDFDYEKCLAALEVFEGNNPYWDDRAKEILADNKKMTEEIEKCLEQFLARDTARRRLKDTILIYYKSFFYAYIDKDLFFEKLAERIGVDKEIIEEQDYVVRRNNGISC